VMITEPYLQRAAQGDGLRRQQRRRIV
jgi:hypothetical protein